MPSLIMFAPTSHAAPKSAGLDKTQLSKSSGSLVRGSDTDTFKCLLVDDNVDLLEMTADLFRDAGFEVFTAVSGKEALQVLKSNPGIDAVLTDVVMPEMSGLELGHEIRKHYPSILVILVSGYPNPASEAGHGSVHHFPFVQKPYRTDQVIRLLIKAN